MSSDLQPVALFVLPGAKADADALLGEIRSSSYVAEVLSDADADEGEPSLPKLVRPVKLSEEERSKLKGVEQCVQHVSSSSEHSKRVLVVADSQTGGEESSLVIVQLDAAGAKEVDRMRIVPKSLLEVVSVGQRRSHAAMREHPGEA